MTTRRPPANTRNKAPVEAPPVDPSVDLRAMQVVSERLAKAKNLRNIYQLERDQLQRMYDVSRAELEKHRTDLLNAEAELEEMEASHQVELKVYRQKIRHLRFEHSLLLDEIKSKADEEIVESTEAHQANLEELRREKQELRTAWDSSAEQFELDFKHLRDEHAHTIKYTKKDSHELQLQRTRQKYEEKIAVLKEELELRRRVEIHEIEEKKNEHINALIRKHDEAFAMMKTYYNKITSNNLNLIRTLKEELASMKQNDAKNERLMFDISQFNDRMQPHLIKEQKKVEELQAQVQAYEKDKLSLHNVRARLRAVKRDLEMLEQDHRELKRKYTACEEDRNGLVARYEGALRELADVAQDRSTALEQKLIDTQGRVEERDAQLNQFLQAINLEPSALEGISSQADAILTSKNRAVLDLAYQLRQIEATSARVNSEYARRCRAAGVPPLDLHQHHHSAQNHSSLRGRAATGSPASADGSNE